jgi:hypothetical protein
MLLQESTTQPTRCKELVRAWSDYIGICDASLFGFGGVIVGENSECPPTVVCLQWPADITNNVKSDSNSNGTITNSDLEMAGLLLVLLIMEEIVCNLRKQNIALFSDNTPTTSWNVFQIHSDVAMRVISILRLKHFLLDKWWRLPKIGSITGPIGPNMSHLRDLTLTYRTHLLHGESEHSRDLPPEHNKEHMARDAKSSLAQSLAMSRPLARRSTWPSEPTR